MTEEPDKQPPFDPTIQTENIAFDAAELIACVGCGRMNPPNRLKCLYCARELEIETEDATSIKPVLRKLEIWERGYNLIVRERAADIDTAKIAQFLSMEIDGVDAIFDAASALPIARVESEKEAELVQLGLRSLGVKCTLISDVDLAAEKPPVRLSGITFFDGRLDLKDFNTGHMTNIATEDLTLIIPGRITVGRIDLLEKKRRGGKTKLIDEMATAADESILDIYSRDDAFGFRVHLTGFDFSCLGDDKGLIASENLRLLIVALKEDAPNARLVNDYTAVKPALSHIWEVVSRKDSQGLVRSGFGKVEFGAVASTNNLHQFTKYSRLQWHLL